LPQKRAANNAKRRKEIGVEEDREEQRRLQAKGPPDQYQHGERQQGVERGERVQRPVAQSQARGEPRAEHGPERRAVIAVVHQQDAPFAQRYAGLEEAHVADELAPPLFREVQLEVG